MNNGYKAFNKDMTCNNFQYKIGETYIHKTPIKLCKSGFHFCKTALECLDFYPFDSIFCEIKHGDNFITDGNKYVTNVITITRQISGKELNEMLTGKIKLYYKNGKLQSELNYVNGKKNGKSLSYYPCGNKKHCGQYEDDMEVGEFKDFYINGKVMNLGLYSKNKLEMKIFFKNGQIFKHFFMENGVVNGKFVVYFDNGQILSQQNYKNGVKDGEFKDFHKSGELLQSGTYTGGNLHGKACEFYKNGNIKATYDFKNGKLHGFVIIFSEKENKIIFQKEYEDNKIKNKSVISKIVNFLI